MRKKCLAWKSGLAGAIAREKMTIFWLGKPRGVFVSQFDMFSFFGAGYFHICFIRWFAESTGVPDWRLT